MIEPIHVISLGAGVQSSTMALMAKHGEITPQPHFAVFADTGDEPDEVYDWLTQLSGWLPFPVYRVMRSRLSEHLLEWGHSQIPAFIRSPVTGKPVIGKRQCTKHWKIVPVNQEIRRRTGNRGRKLKPGTIVSWQGISWDEIARMRESREAWIAHRFPLIELRMRREDCLRWMKTSNYPEPPKSACVECPYQDRDRWAKTKAEGGRGWATCVSVSRQLEARGEFLTKDLLPIDEIDFAQVGVPDGQEQFTFADECDGMCGL